MGSFSSPHTDGDNISGHEPIYHAEPGGIHENSIFLQVASAGKCNPFFARAEENLPPDLAEAEITLPLSVICLASKLAQST